MNAIPPIGVIAPSTLMLRRSPAFILGPASSIIPGNDAILRTKWTPDAPRVVVIHPYVSFGRPVLAGTGIPTAVIADRYKAGESIESLADDYGRNRLEIEDAIRSELQLEAA